MADLQQELDALRTSPSAACLSDFEIDQLLVGDLSESDAKALLARIDACDHCRTRLEQFQADTQAFARRPVPIWLGASKRQNVLRTATAVAAAAAALFLFVRPQGEDMGEVRLKGGDHFGYLIVAPGGVIRGDESTAVAAPGDELQWRFGTAQDSYVAVFGRDASDVVSVYYPRGGAAEFIRAGSREPLPLALELDGALGEEELFGLVCNTNVELEPIRLSIERGEALVPNGCAIHEAELTKKNLP